jgi:protein-tyrosine phosphatase
MTRPNAPRSPRRLRIVFVCTGNRFRSPLAAAYVRRLLSGLGFEIVSCGTAGDARTARGPLPEAEEIAVSSAIDLSQHRTCSLDQAHLADADLVLGFERVHVAMAVLDGGAPQTKTFLFTELVDLLPRRAAPTDLRDPAARVRALVAAADRARIAAATSSAEVPDPYGQSRKTYERTALEVWRLALELVARLFPSPPMPPAALPRPRLRRAGRRPRVKRRGSA